MQIKIGPKGFPTTLFGYFHPESVHDVPTHFAKFCVEKMRSAVYVEKRKPGRPKKTSTEAK